MNTGSYSNLQQTQAQNWELKKVETGEVRANGTTKKQSNVPVGLCSQMPILSGCFGDRENVGFQLFRNNTEIITLSGQLSGRIAWMAWMRPEYHDRIRKICT